MKILPELCFRRFCLCGKGLIERFRSRSGNLRGKRGQTLCFGGSDPRRECGDSVTDRLSIFMNQIHRPADWKVVQDSFGKTSDFILPAVEDRRRERITGTARILNHSSWFAAV